MQNTKIQWCDDTVNAVMGCLGCELWPPRSQVISKLKEVIGGMRPNLVGLDARIDGLAGRYQNVNDLVLMKKIVNAVFREDRERKEAVRQVKSILRCYAGILHLYRGGKIAGYAEDFRRPTLFPGRVGEAARRRNLLGTDRAEKPWLNGMPRLI